MIVISKKGSTKLIKGHKYEVQRIRNSMNKGFIHLKGIGSSYICDNFTDVDGNELKKIDWQSPIEKEKRLEFEQLKVNDILVCKSGGYTTLMLGFKYRIVDLKVSTKTIAGWNGVPRAYTTKKVKFEGSNRYYDYNTWKFRGLTLDESREDRLSVVLDNEVKSYSVDVINRRINIVADKDAVLIRALSKSINDPYRHALDVVDWACQKSSPKLKIKREDFNHLSKMSLEDILKIVDKK